MKPPLEGISRISGHIFMNPPVLCFLSIGEDEGEGNLRDWAEGLKRAMVRTKKWLPFQHPKTRTTSQVRERPETSEACMFASTYYRLSL